MRIGNFSKNDLIIALVIAGMAVIVIVGVAPTIRLANAVFQKSQRLTGLKESGSLTRKLPTGEIKEVDDPAAIVLSLVSKSIAKHRAIISKIEPGSEQYDGDVRIITQQVSLQGNFVDLLQVLQTIHVELFPIKIVSLHFEKKLDPERKSVLVLTIYFQAVKLNNEK